MSYRITKKDIERQVNILAELSNTKKTEDCKQYLAIDYAPVYGGYRLVMVGSENGAHYGAFNQSSCCSRMSAKEFSFYLSGLISGIESVKKNSVIGNL